MRRRLFAAAVVTAATLAGVVPAVAQVAQPAVVSADPVDWTPHVLDGTVHAIAVVGDTVVVGGTFSTLATTAGARYRQDYLFAFGATDGRLRRFAPRLDGPVYSLAAGPDGTVYVGGSFRTVNGAPQRGLARLSVATGARDTGFAASIAWGDVRALAVSGRWLYAGGAFPAVNRVPRAGLARLDAASGAVDSGFDAGLAGADRVRVEDFALAPGGGRLAVAGAFTQVAGQPRVQLALLDTSGPRAALVNWYTDGYRDVCDGTYDTYLRGVDFAPDGSYFVVVSTGNDHGPTRLCDAAARFDVAGTGRRNPTWVNHTGGNTLLSVAVTGTAVYVGGHQQWLDNPHGHKTAGPGAVSRPGIGAIDPRTGKALPWNPTRSRGVGVRAFLATPNGLWVGSDTDRLGNEYHGRIGMFPL
ncbi:delta-60 repeat domain-containing protein [Phytohabitans sp. ZYX-F-186]|uniref:Delta-60 repeat domain-containing protein n=1 Tax=Phytohabitans maris TaxID=3071409 RepID=A0ABU0ZRK8_9ACTN|nr:delta-60 repeat domain-containing protein [Phytohabitans sp. ZYX-F-186]MDQ7909593.1 delta-60 repeat domain-containing protein [Phytohabitans sp. ZYX-F-186]